jgi:dethiobiotin synthetase
MKKIFITATNTDVGKTYTAVKLLQHFATMGYRVGAFKPIETGVVSSPLDATKLLHVCQVLNSDFQAVTIDDICPIRFRLPAAPFVAAEGAAISLYRLDEKIELFKNLCDILIIEGAGGLLVPIACDYYMIDLIARWRATPLLVTHDRLGSINDTLLSLAQLKERGLTTNWCVNLRDESAFDAVTRPFYEACFPQIVTLQHDIEQIANSLLSN